LASARSVGSFDVVPAAEATTAPGAASGFTGIGVATLLNGFS
jgi:hypothetical protein